METSNSVKTHHRIDRKKKGSRRYPRVKLRGTDGGGESNATQKPVDLGKKDYVNLGKTSPGESRQEISPAGGKTKRGNLK